MRQWRLFGSALGRGLRGPGRKPRLHECLDFAPTSPRRVGAHAPICVFPDLFEAPRTLHSVLGHVVSPPENKSMKALFNVLLVLSPLAGAVTPAASIQGGGPNGSDGAVVFEDVHVLPMDGERILEHHTIVVRGDRIDQLGPNGQVAVPDEAVRVDGAGMYLLPGLVDMHVHLRDTTDERAIANYLSLFVANGVTTVRVMTGRPVHLRIREQVARSELLGPTIYVAGSTVGSLDSTLDMRRVLTSKEATRFAEQMKAAGYDFIQVGSLMREEYEGLVRGARRGDIRLAGGVPNGVGFERVLKSKQSSIEGLGAFLPELEADDSPLRHADPVTRSRLLLKYLDEGKIPKIAKRLRDARVAVVPNLYLNEAALSRVPPEVQAQYPEMRYVAPRIIEAWILNKWRMVRRGLEVETVTTVVDLRRKLAKGLHEGGARLLVGSDARASFIVPGFGTHREIETLVTAGLSPFSVLEAATRAGAEYLVESADFGTIAVGQRADLILAKGNPLDDITNVGKQAGVMLRGRWIPEEEIEATLDAIARAAAES